MTTQSKQLELTLKKHGYSLTQARQTVFQALQHQEPQSIHELILRCQQTIDRASVYRTITLFEQLGIVQRLHIGWKYKLELSDSFHEHHHHVSCSRCGMSSPLIENEALEQQLRVLAQAQGFLPQSHELEIRGLCANCQTI